MMLFVIVSGCESGSQGALAVVGVGSLSDRGRACVQRGGVPRTWHTTWRPECAMGSWDDAGFSERREGLVSRCVLEGEKRTRLRWRIAASCEGPWPAQVTAEGRCSSGQRAIVSST